MFITTITNQHHKNHTKQIELKYTPYVIPLYVLRTKCNKHIRNIICGLLDNVANFSYFLQPQGLTESPYQQINTLLPPLFHIQSEMMKKESVEILVQSREKRVTQKIIFYWHKFSGLKNDKYFFFQKLMMDLPINSF
jgi:hypothetical protein